MAANLRNRVCKIRGHHLLCLLTFRGLGYSRDFIENFKKKVKDFSSKEATVLLTTEADVICSACPYCKNGRCIKKENSQKRVSAHDKKVLKLFDLKEGRKVKIKQVLTEIKRKISPKDLLKICKKCSWLGHCANLSKFN